MHRALKTPWGPVCILQSGVSPGAMEIHGSGRGDLLTPSQFLSPQGAEAVCGSVLGAWEPCRPCSSAGCMRELSTRREG